MKKLNEYEKKKIDDFFAKADVLEILAKMKDAAPEDANTFTGLVISTEHVDRTGDIVRQEGIDTDAYMKNPIILNSHNYYGIENIVGRTTKLYKGLCEGVPATFADGVWAPTEGGEMAKALWDAKCLSAASVGFIPKEFAETDKGGIDYHDITKSELLEYSVVPVPANSWATRQDGMKILTAKGITEAALVMKGFEIDSKREPTGEAQGGDECSMTDGTIGVFAERDGKLVCVPKEEKAITKTTPETGGDNDPLKSSMWEDLKSEHGIHEKAIKSHIKEYTDAVDAEDEKKPADDASDDDKKVFAEASMKALADHEKKLKTVLKAEHERHIKAITECYKSYGKKPDDDSDDQSGQEGQDDSDIDNEKIFAHIKAAAPFLTDEQLALVVKAATEMNDAMHKKLTTLCESIEKGHGMHGEATDIHTKAIDEFKALLAEHEPNEGDESEKSHPEKRSTPAVAADLPDVEIVQLARELNTATREALTRFNHATSRKG